MPGTGVKRSHQYTPKEQLFSDGGKHRQREDYRKKPSILIHGHELVQQSFAGSELLRKKRSKVKSPEPASYGLNDRDKAQNNAGHHPDMERLRAGSKPQILHGTRMG